MQENATPRARRVVVIGVSPGLNTALARSIYVNAAHLEAQVSIVAKQGSASALSLFALLSLGARVGDRVEVTAVGPEAARACNAIVALLLGEEPR
ncbi:HPr family phosphocarrier protein [Enhygromyxa salina]|uniref:PTS system phosphohistidinoprotein-hexose phosphotransferase subunit Hpr n=1 Tax=Enhygromyxa salina TaxID=215803 RepID=A0A2S9YTC9_9BACT|nr:HPr family phosphocarrier protein [Enhygromyxa salina]PRQ08367.1 PTS system phosphohistidinoprotein-hexose phosphotransferase subunit Hpr [Enhygromyxa salina]